MFAQSGPVSPTADVRYWAELPGSARLIGPNRRHSDQRTHFPKTAVHSCSDCDRFSVVLARAGRCLLTFVSSSWTSSGCINAKLSGTSRQITRVPVRAARKRRCSLLRCAFSITKIRSAQLTSSAVSGFSASWLVPAESTSRSSRRENTCSAVGLRSLFWLQTNRTVRTRALNLPPIYHARRVGMAQHQPNNRPGARDGVAGDQQPARRVR